VVVVPCRWVVTVSLPVFLVSSSGAAGLQAAGALQPARRADRRAS
jgi:hypothetical protein